MAVETVRQFHWDLVDCKWVLGGLRPPFGGYIWALGQRLKPLGVPGGAGAEASIESRQHQEPSRKTPI